MKVKFVSEELAFECGMCHLIPESDLGVKDTPYYDAVLTPVLKCPVVRICPEKYDAIVEAVACCEASGYWDCNNLYRLLEHITE